MSDQERFFIGPTLRTKLREVITRVGAMPQGGGPGGIPTRLQGMPPIDGLWLQSQTNWVLAQNNSGYAAPPYCALAINGMISDPEDGGSSLEQFLERPIIDAGYPTENSRAKFVVTAETIESGAVGRVWVSGVVPVAVKIEDETHQFAAMWAGGGMRSVEAGDAAILWKGADINPTGGVPNCLIRMGHRDHTTIRLGKYVGEGTWEPQATYPWSPNSVKLFDKGDDNFPAAPVACQEVAPEQTVTAYNMFRTIKSGSWVVVGIAPDRCYYVLEASNQADACRRIGDTDVADIPGWDDTKIQLLGHDTSGCLHWYDTTNCSGA